jgi:hypothetical protein
MIGVRLLCGVALLLPSICVAGEKVATNMHAPGVYVRDACFVTPVYTIVPTSPVFVNGTSKGKFQLKDNCKLALKLIKLNDTGSLPVSDGVPGTGDEVICQVHLLNGTAGACESILLRGEVQGNNPAARKVGIKLDLSVEAGLAVCNPGTGTNRMISHVECYEPLPGFLLGAACAAAPGTVAPFVSDPTQGVCHSASNNIPNPVSPLIASWGVRQ